MRAVLYIHGMGGSAAESGHYAPLFPGCAVAGLDYRTFTPWETGGEIRSAVQELNARYGDVTLIANSIGAYFSLHAGLNGLVSGAYFISPVVDMEALILGRMAEAGVTEAELRARGVVPVPSGAALSWEYLCFVRDHPVEWDVPTRILYGSRDTLTSPAAIRDFVRRHGAALTVMENGEHWFHTAEQTAFLDDWIRKGEGARKEQNDEKNDRILRTEL